MKCWLIYKNEDPDLIQSVVNLQTEKGIRVVGYHSGGNNTDLKNVLDDCIGQHISNLLVFELTVLGDRMDKIIKTLSRFFGHGIQIDLYTNGKIISIDSFACFTEEVLLVLFNNLRSNHRSKIKTGQNIAKLNGKKIGRKSYISSDLIKGMRSEGVSIREISSKTGISITSIWRHTREMPNVDITPEVCIEN